MAFNWKGLFLYFLLFFFVGDPLRELIMIGETDLLRFDHGARDVWLMGSTLLIFFLYCLLAYATLYYFFPKKQWLMCSLGILISLVLPIAVRYVVQEQLFEMLLDFSNYPNGYGTANYIRDNLYYSFRFVFFGAFYYLISFSFYKEKREKSLRIANQKMELSLLRSQINPHFLLNALNNIYSLVYHQSEKSLEALDTLSGLLKYSLYETQETVSIREELSYIHQFIALYKLRLSYPLAIDLDIDESILESQMPQFLLVPLIENAFKHGNLKDPNHPLGMSISGHDRHIAMRVENQKGTHLRDHTGGIGLENVQKRLTLLYPEDHTFVVEETEETFVVRIKIPRT